MNRGRWLAQLADPAYEWDILIIGGGATGLGAALEAASKGYRTLLLEQSDFAKSTSSKSTKLVHGGVRYLAQGDIALVREASIERGLLHRNAPHLVRNQHFIIPVYSLSDRLKYTIGLKLYDWISGRMSLGPSGFIARGEALKQMPGVKTEGLLGGVSYHDGQFDDSRLAINLAQTIFEKGGCALNYMAVTGLLKTGNRLSGVTATDTETGTVYTVKAKAVINATGVFVDDILRMDNSAAHKTIRVSQGVHLVLDRKFFPSDHALMIPKTADGRVLFAVPWHDKLVVGTTDTPVEHASLEPVALEKEITFILQTAGAYLSEQPQRSDVKSVFAGLRPLAASQGEGKKTKEISRSHKIIVSGSQLFTILGGKWTTYRKMGEDLIGRVEKELGWQRLPTATASLPIHGSDNAADRKDPLYYYGSDLNKLKETMNAHQDRWLSKELYVHEAQVRWAVEHEMARTVEDVLARRTRTLLLDAEESIRIARPVAEVMADVLHKDGNWINQQVAAFETLAAHYRLN
ncbi:glycerol-3-phosphate dehydrogenase/oxidase [Sediminibacterium sp. WSJ-3]|nr:glycerol-3-phosphate dehydrogenase/oxidase [Sediminibacterium soli]